MPVDTELLVLGDLLVETGAFDPTTAVQVERHGYREGAIGAALLVPVHDQETVIVAHLESMVACCTSRHEVVVVIDGCTDESGERVRAWARGALGGLTHGITIVDVPAGIFETLSDNLAAVLARAEVLIEVQADMEIEHRGFDSVLISALDQEPDVFAISGRGLHPFPHLEPAAPSNLAAALVARAQAALVAGVRRGVTRGGSYRPTVLELWVHGEVGRTGELIELPLAAHVGDSILFVGDTVMRGPLAMRREQFLDLGGFDARHFFLGHDDHDLMARALLLRGWRCGYLPLRFSSPLELGSTRRSRPPAAEARFRTLQQHYERARAGSVLSQRAHELTGYRTQVRHLTSP